MKANIEEKLVPKGAAVTRLPTKSQFAVIIVMGVSGSGKSTLGAALAAEMGKGRNGGGGMLFVDGDDFHPEANVKKLTAGIPLTDADRKPWLRSIRENTKRLAKENVDCSGDGTGRWKRVVVACSALKRDYRDYLRFGDVSEDGDAKGYSDDASSVSVETFFVFIDGPEDVLKARMSKRQGHFMKVQMLESQLATLEDPKGEEGVVVVELEMSTEEQVRKALEGLRREVMTIDGHFS